MPQASPDKINSLVDDMTLEEQVSLLAGADVWTTGAIDRLGIPAIKVSDGPNGARGGGSLIGGLKAAAFPVAISLAATWDVDIVREIGVALAAEARSKGARVLLAPTVNMQRSTRSGRNFEYYSEDPELSSEIAVAYIEGLQSQGVAATIKHFVGNDSEYQRTTISSNIDERTLREIYLPPFEAAVKRAHVWALMTGYNRLNGNYVALVNDLLKNEWGFDGVVMSDWFGTNSTAEAMNAGLDLEMPGPTRRRGAKLLEAIRVGKVQASAVRESACRILRLVERVGAFEDPAIQPETAEDRPQTRALIRRAGADGIVLLKNKAILPLRPNPSQSIALIGPNAAVAQIMGGGSAQLNPHYSISPLEGLRAALPNTVEIAHERGCANDRLVPLLESETVTEIFSGRKWAGEPLKRLTRSEGQLMFLGDAGHGFKPADCSASLKTNFVAKVTGDHEFGVIATGPVQLLIDGDVAVDGRQFRAGDEYFGMGCNEIVVTRRLEAGRSYALTLEYTSPDSARRLGITALRLGVAPVLGDASMDRAVELAARSDVALAFVGLTGEWDAEGKDRPGIDLPGRQNELIERIAAANPRTVVVLQSGCPVTMPWLDRVAGVMQAWYPGQEAGSSIADVLIGACDPGGRLPQTFPRRLEDDPTFINYPGEAGVVRYGEGIFVGYRYYEKKDVAPLFPFGFGLSYTKFELAGLELSADRVEPGEAIEASVEVANTGDRPGSTVVQVYVADEAASVARPRKELKAFQKVRLAPGERRRVGFSLEMRDLAWFDVAHQQWRAEAGTFALELGFSSADIHVRANFVLTKEWTQPVGGTVESLK